jgi:type II secretory pathway pseudopilin PulG
MTLIEIVIVVVIIALGASGLSFSLGAVTKANLRAGAGKLASAMRYSYNRAVMKGTTVRVSFDVPGSTFSIEEAHGGVTLARLDSDDARNEPTDEGSAPLAAADPWAAAESRISNALKPNLGASPFSPLVDSEGKSISRYTKVSLGRRVQIVKLLVPHHPDPLEQGPGAVHFFPGGMTEHAVIHLSDGGDTVYSIELHPLTGRSKIRAEAYEPRDFLDDPDEDDISELDP